MKAGYDPQWTTDLAAYWTDAAQRAVLFTDILRKRGNTYLEHLHRDQPPVLVFDYETILDGRDFERPVNYAAVATDVRWRRSSAAPSGTDLPSRRRSLPSRRRSMIRTRA